ncbi:MAG: dihydrodipicolinate synthase family protein [Candidatus Hydrogenedentes bacterium]|nr:dihydrodipicolinate synthase family protein [Candidatus Hydrogenedentota bacterium]
MTDFFVRGAISNVFTVWDDQGRFDPDGQRNLLDYLYDAGSISTYFVRSGMGQMYAYQYDDVKAMASLACAHLAGRAPVLVGTAGIWDKNYDKRPDPGVFMQQAVELSQFAEQQGAAGVVHTMPEALLPRDGETHADVILRYFERISDAVQVPIWLYQPPGTQKEYCVTMDLAVRLAEIPRVAAMKVSTVDAQYIYNLCYAMAPLGFKFIAGSECGFLAALYAGASACIGQGCTLNPVTIKAIQDRYEAGDQQGAIEAQRSTNYLVEVGVSTVEWFKRYITDRGYPVSTHARDMGANPYVGAPAPLTQDAYESFKAVFEAELLKFDTVPPRR